MPDSASFNSLLVSLRRVEYVYRGRRYVVLVSGDNGWSVQSLSRSAANERRNVLGQGSSGVRYLMQRPVTEQATVVVSKNLVSATIAEEVVILDEERGLYYSIDGVGGRVWSLIQQPTTPLAIRDVLVNEYAVEPEPCARDVVQLLQQMADASLVKVIR